MRFRLSHADKISKKYKNRNRIMRHGKIKRNSKKNWITFFPSGNIELKKSLGRKKKVVVTKRPPPHFFFFFSHSQEKEVTFQQLVPLFWHWFFLAFLEKNNNPKMSIPKYPKPKIFSRVCSFLLLFPWFQHALTTYIYFCCNLFKGFSF